MALPPLLQGWPARRDGNQHRHFIFLRRRDFHELPSQHPGHPLALLENTAPEGRTNLAQRFSAGKSGKNDLSPGGTTQFSRPLESLLLIATIRLPLRLRSFLHCFPLFLVCLVQHLLLLLDRLTGLARIFLGTDALSLSRY